MMQPEPNLDLTIIGLTLEWSTFQIEVHRFKIILVSADFPMCDLGVGQIAITNDVFSRSTLPDLITENTVIKGTIGYAERANLPKLPVIGMI